MLRPTGPELLSPHQIAAAFAEVLGRSVRYIDVSERMLSKTLSVLEPDRFTHAQVVNYVREYHRGTLGVGGPNDVVQQITGRPAEGFTSIVRRYAGSDPTVRRSVANTLRVLADMVRITLTPPMNVKRWERSQGLPYINDAEDCADASEWRRTHAAPDAFAVTRTGSQRPRPASA